ncbi:MAG: hypothetical protein OEY56_07935 [Cyclobacteriaceae bacterium]|nr:hypothetical protein [Cyclobacteriaceae bacterium]
MAKSELLYIAIKIFGLYFIVQFVQYFIDFLFMVVGNNLFTNDAEMIYVFAGIAITGLVYLIFGVLAIFKTELIARRILRPTSELVNISTSKLDIIEIALVTISVLAIVYSIPSILSQTVDNIYFHDPKETEFWTKSTKGEFFESVFITVIGIFLLLNARNFAKMIVKRGERDDRHDEESER